MLQVRSKKSLQCLTPSGFGIKWPSNLFVFSNSSMDVIIGERCWSYSSRDQAQCVCTWSSSGRWLVLDKAPGPAPMWATGWAGPWAGAGLHTTPKSNYQDFWTISWIQRDLCNRFNNAITVINCNNLLQCLKLHNNKSWKHQTLCSQTEQKLTFVISMCSHWFGSGCFTRSGGRAPTGLMASCPLQYQTQLISTLWSSHHTWYVIHNGYVYKFSPSMLRNFIL